MTKIRAVLLSLLLPTLAMATNEPPGKMALLDAVKLRAEIAELQVLQLQEAPHRQRISEICARAKIDPAQLGQTVGVNYETGEIVRASPAPAK